MQNLAKTPDHIDALVAAFKAAEYIVDAPDNAIVIRVGETTADLDRMLGGRPWAIVTAHNPDGQLCTSETNAAAQRSLKKRLRESRPWALLAVCNHDPAGLWPDEPAFLFTPRNISEADCLARGFGQRAVVSGRAGGPAHLRIYGESEHAPATMPAVAS